MRPDSLPPGPRSSYPFEVFVRFRKDATGFLRDCAEYGDLVGFSLGRQDFVLVNHPDLIRDLLVTHQKSFQKGRALERARMMLGNGLLTSEGEFHLRQRRLAQPAFHRERIAHYAEAMIEYAERASTALRDGDAVDAHKLMMALTLGIVAKTLFDADVDHEAQEIGEALSDVFDGFSLAMLPFVEYLQWLPLPAMNRFRRGRRRLDQTIYRIIAERRAHGGDRGDLLSMLMEASDAEGDGTGMTDEQLRDEVMTIFLAGHETTANALTWAWYLLARNPEIEARMHKEIDALGHAPTVEDYPKLDYTRRVVMETMRLYPPAYAIGRRAIEDYPVGGFTLPNRTIVLCSPYVQHRDPRWFPEPDKFDPDRWLPDAVAKRPKFSYFPFGAGTRICIGEQFAWTEAVLVLATMARKWKFWIAPKQRIALDPRITLRPKYGMQMVAMRR